MMNSNPQHRSYVFVCRLLAGLLLATWLAPAAHGDGWPYLAVQQRGKAGQAGQDHRPWSDTVLTQTGRPPIRGFGGRLMFYEGKKEEPIKVDGTLVVYAFDETDRDANNARPDRKYVFTPQQLPPHYSKSKIGHSYSVWLPWDEVGGMQKEITLIVRFQPKEGPVAISDPCRQLLPGRIAPANRAAGFADRQQPDRANCGCGLSRQPRQRQGVQPASYQRRSRKAQESDGGMAAAADDDDDDRRAFGIGDPLGDHFAAGFASGWGQYQPGPGQAKPAPCELPAAELSAAGICSAGVAFGSAWPATTIWFCTWSTVASRRTTRSAKSRSCSVAATPRRIAVRPCISTWTGPCQCSAGSARRCSAIAELTCCGWTATVGSNPKVKVVRTGGSCGGVVAVHAGTEALLPLTPSAMPPIPPMPPMPNPPPPIHRPFRPCRNSHSPTGRRKGWLGLRRRSSAGPFDPYWRRRSCRLSAPGPPRRSHCSGLECPGRCFGQGCSSGLLLPKALLVPGLIPLPVVRLPNMPEERSVHWAATLPGQPGAWQASTPAQFVSIA